MCDVRKMVLGHLGQFNGIRCESRILKFLYKCILLSGNLFVFHYVISFQTRILNSIALGISRLLESFLYFGTFCFFCHPLLPTFRGRDNPKKAKILEENKKTLARAGWPNPRTNTGDIE